MFLDSFSRLNFNPRSLAGATYCIYDRKGELIFQSTLPRGSDQTIQDFCSQNYEFQSTLPRGSDIVRISS